MDQLSQGIVITIIAALFLALVAVGIVVLILVYQKKQIGFQKEKEKQLMASRLETQEQTFREISQELHDNIGQALTLVKININTIDFEKKQDAVEKLAGSKVLLTAALKDLRNLAKSLSTDFIHDTGLEKAVQQQLQLLQRTGHYATHLSVSSATYRLPAAHELILFRMVQELLNNIVKHADATAITVSMDYQEDKLIVKVQDNGKGFDADSRDQTGAAGLGLRNVHNRAKLINGVLTFKSAPQQGTTAIIELSR